MKSISYFHLQHHPSYKYPNRYQIDQALQELDYEFFVPYSILEDIIALYSWYISIGMIPSFVLDNPFLDTRLQTFYAGLPLAFLGGSHDSPLHKAVNAMKLLAKDYDLRALSRGVVAEKTRHNFDQDLDPSAEILLINETTKLNEAEQGKLIRLIELLRKELPTMEEQPEEVLQEQNLQSFSDLPKLRKSTYVRPDFSYNLVMKNLRTKRSTKLLESEEILIYLEDASTSMGKGINFLATKAIHTLLCNDPRPVYYYRFAHKVEMEILATKQEKLKAFSQEKKYYASNCDFKLVIDTARRDHPRGNIILSTDGEDVCDPFVVLEQPIFVVSKTVNKQLANLSKRTNGKFLVI